MSVPQPYLSQREFWDHVFSSVIEQYITILTNSGQSPAIDYTAIGTGGSAAGNMKVVRPSQSDFLCDVEIAARRALSKTDYMYLREVVFDAEDPLAGLPMVTDSVRQQVGKMFLSRQIFPMGTYFLPRDLR